MVKSCSIALRPCFTRKLWFIISYWFQWQNLIGMKIKINHNFLWNRAAIYKYKHFSNMHGLFPFFPWKISKILSIALPSENAGSVLSLLQSDSYRKKIIKWTVSNTWHMENMCETTIRVLKRKCGQRTCIHDHTLE